MTGSAQPALDIGAVLPFPAQSPAYDTTAKRENLARLIAAREAGDLRVDSCPAYVRFEPHAACNLRCCWAQRSKGHPGLRPRGAADVALAEQVVEQCGAALYQVILCHWGEPLLNERLPEIVRVFHDAGIYTTFDTNMTLMTPELAEALIAAGLDRISASIDGVSQGVYGQYRAGGRVDQALEGLRMLVAARRRSMESRPVIRWQYLVFPHNTREVERAESLAAEIGVDTIDIFAAGGRRWTREDGFLPAVSPERPEGLLCDDPWMYLAIDWDGAVHLCCRAFQARHVCGHLGKASIREIFDNDRFQLARRVIRDGIWREPEPSVPCTGCRRLTGFVPAIAELNHKLTLE